MKVKLFIICFILISCNSKIESSNNNQIKNESFNINPLKPYSYEFVGENASLNRIDYFYLSGKLDYNKNFYKELQKTVYDKEKEIKNNYNLYSIYIYRETEELNASYNEPRESFDGKNKDLIAYIRFAENINDIFYIIKDGKVIYDCVEDSPMSFEFDQ